jgi:hypothetical protein
MDLVVPEFRCQIIYYMIISVKSAYHDIMRKHLDQLTSIEHYERLVDRMELIQLTVSLLTVIFKHFDGRLPGSSESAVYRARACILYRRSFKLASKSGKARAAARLRQAGQGPGTPAGPGGPGPGVRAAALADGAARVLS